MIGCQPPNFLYFKNQYFQKKKTLQNSTKLTSDPLEINVVITDKMCVIMCNKLIYVFIQKNCVGSSINLIWTIIRHFSSREATMPKACAILKNNFLIVFIQKWAN